MFHRYVTHNGERIDYDRARWLMSEDVFDAARKQWPAALGVDEFDLAIAARMGSSTASRHTPEEELQIFWDLYCKAHAEKYGRPFSPDVM